MSNLISPAAVGLTKPLSVIVASGSATVDIETTFDSTYDEYLILASGITTDNGSADLRFRLKIAAAYDTGANYVEQVFGGESDVATLTNVRAAAGTYVDMNCGIQTPSAAAAASASAQFEIRISNPSDTTKKKKVTWRGTFFDKTPALWQVWGTAANTGTGALTGFRFYPSADNIVAGTFRLYGFKKT